METIDVVVALLILLALVFTWFGLYYLTNKQLDHPDARARITGNCGDTMEIALQFRDGRVINASTWTNGCSYSKSCIEATGMLVRNRSLTELHKITMMTIMEQIGQLPDTHLHCAQLAETTLQHALKDYLAKQGPVCCHPS